MDYQTIYEEALEKARDLFGRTDHAFSHLEVRRELVAMFPELLDGDENALEKQLYENLYTNNPREVAEKYIGWITRLKWRSVDGHPYFKAGNVIATSKNSQVKYKIMEVDMNGGEYVLEGIDGNGKLSGSSVRQPIEKVDYWAVVINSEDKIKWKE